jgi:glycosidase
VQTWLPVNPNYVNGVNVKDQENIGTSLFECYRRLLKLRKNLPALQIGKFEENISPNKQVYSFFRYTDSENLLIVCNLGQNTERVIVGHDTSILFSTKEDVLQLDKDSLVLSPFTGGILNPAVDQYPLDRA